MSSDLLDSYSWQVDLPASRVRHDSGFTARICGMPMTEAELRGLNAEGLVAVGMFQSENGERWAIMATMDSITLAEVILRSERKMTIGKLAHIAGKAWMRAYAPRTIDESFTPRAAHPH